ncbi:hypothetical protein MtrunA17_Chr1g0194931 [Medicago truncatula]|nr:hypothetical protein MtrunA17_Chr1g0194931 [Medicago truncatula]
MKHLDDHLVDINVTLRESQIQSKVKKFRGEGMSLLMRKEKII